MGYRVWHTTGRRLQREAGETLEERSRRPIAHIILGFSREDLILVCHSAAKHEARADKNRLAYQSVGIIYGDVGTSPLYVYSSTFSSAPSYDDLLGVLSLIIWSLTLMVTVKYVLIILRADNEGEGGTFSTYSLLSRYVRMLLLSSSSALTSIRLTLRTAILARLHWLKCNDSRLQTYGSLRGVFGVDLRLAISLEAS